MTLRPFTYTATGVRLVFGDGVAQTRLVEEVEAVALTEQLPVLAGRRVRRGTYYACLLTGSTLDNTGGPSPTHPQPRSQNSCRHGRKRAVHAAHTEETT